MCLRVNYSDTHFTCDPIVDGIIEESPKETNNGCFDDEKKHVDLDGLDYDANCDLGHQTISNSNSVLNLILNFRCT